MKLQNERRSGHRENVMGAPAAATGGLKGIIAGSFSFVSLSPTFVV